ncbi:MAG: hypothetical protein O2960_09060, partial [Verrucomicrobia bacterium]|nr:hypothetical protein [Verrucomicrobiota bacterium]
MSHRVEIQHHFARVLGQAARAHLQQTGFDLFRIMPILVRAALFVVGQHQPVERRSPSQGDPAMLRAHAIQT